MSLGTTELSTAPVMASRSTLCRPRMSRSSMAYWSSIRALSVAMRETNSSSSPSYTPMVTLVFPTSNASSISFPPLFSSGVIIPHPGEKSKSQGKSFTAATEPTRATMSPSSAAGMVIPSRLPCQAPKYTATA